MFSISASCRTLAIIGHLVLLTAIVGQGNQASYDSGCLLRIPAAYKGEYAGKCITAADVNEALKEAIAKRGFYLPDYTEIDRTGKLGDILWETTVILVYRFKIPTRLAAHILPYLDTTKTDIWNICPNYYKPNYIQCVASKYSRISGDCNDLNNPIKGSAGRLLKRLLPNAYADGLGYQRVSVVGGQPLPNARAISNKIHYDITPTLFDKPWNMWFLIFGQFMDHEILLANNFPQNYQVPNGKYECCKYKGHHDCMPIPVPLDDEIWGNVSYPGPKKTCMNFIRAMPGVWQNCALGPREQWNSATPIIDSSHIYGPSYGVHTILKDPNPTGLMKTYNPFPSTYRLKPLLPQKTRRPDYSCLRKSPDKYCLLAGDERGAMQPALMSLQILWLRLHNWLVYKLKEINPHWDYDRLFEEARRINIAYNQHITLNEWMPILLDASYLDRYYLRPAKLYRYDYDPYIDPQISQPFAVAAYRFAHSTVPDHVEYHSRSHKMIKEQLLGDMLDVPDDLYEPGLVDHMTVGALNQPIYLMDQHLGDEVRNYLFKGYNHFGEDLAVRNIMRSREHGVGGYLAYRRLCKMKPIYGWNDLRYIMPNKTVDDLSKIYKHVEDIDLWVGGVTEYRVGKGIIGPVFSCLISDQFSRIVRGDRFWYENPGFPNSFTPEQLKEIKKVSLARILCDQSDDLETVQRWAMQLADYGSNKRYPCNSNAIPKINLEPWREKAPYYNNKY